MTYSVTSCLFLARACDDKLERVAVTARDEDSTTALLFFGGSGGKKIIRLETRRFRILTSSNKRRVPSTLRRQPRRGPWMGQNRHARLAASARKARFLRQTWQAVMTNYCSISIT